MSEVATNLTKVLEVLGPNGENWNKGQLYNVNTGGMCVAGAINTVKRGNALLSGVDGKGRREVYHSPEMAALWNALPDELKIDNRGHYSYWDVISWQDEDDVPFEELKHLIESAIEAENAK